MIGAEALHSHNLTSWGLLRPFEWLMASLCFQPQNLSKIVDMLKKCVCWDCLCTNFAEHPKNINIFLSQAYTNLKFRREYNPLPQSLLLYRKCNNQTLMVVAFAGRGTGNGSRRVWNLDSRSLTATVLWKCRLLRYPESRIFSTLVYRKFNACRLQC